MFKIYPFPITNSLKIVVCCIMIDKKEGSKKEQRLLKEIEELKSIIGELTLELKSRKRDILRRRESMRTIEVHLMQSQTEDF